MTDIEDDDTEDKSRSNTHSNNDPDGPHKVSACIGNTEQSNSDAAFDSRCASSIEELEDKVDLWIESVPVSNMKTENRRRKSTLVPFNLSAVEIYLESCPLP
jgi:hypothetical protein